ncbi:MAG: zinc ribbon domain-containing protein [Candidatus Methanomethylophilaceae archaeon]|nr:zinc ribbon domain-containing protein [Candidatus Methanomethylophilaceae archaeon]
MYCPVCGKEVTEDAVFCPYCSASLREAKNFSRSRDEGPKSTAVAMILSIIFPGTGAFYIKNDVRGILVFVVCLVSALVGMLMFVVLPVLAVSLLIQAVLWVYGLMLTSKAIDDYRKEYPI